MAKLLRGAAIILAALFMSSAGTPLRAQDVTLTSRDGAIELSGTLQAYDGEFYRVDTVYGVLTLAAEGVTCAGPGCPDLTTFVAEFTIVGSRTMGETLMPALIADFAASQRLALHVEESGDAIRFRLSDAATHQPVVRIALRVSSSDSGLIDLLAGEADIALSLSELRDDDVQVRVVALDAFVPVVGQGNPVDRITMPELASVLSGSIDNWADLGWMEAPIILHARNGMSGVQQALEAQLLAPLGLPLADGARRHDSDADLLQAVAGNPFALGVAFLSDTGPGGLIGSGTPLTLHGECGFALPATPLSVKAEDYPLTAPLLLHVRSERQPLQVRRFLSHIAGPSAQAAIRQAGFIDQEPESQAIAEQGRRLANAVLAAGDDVGLGDLQRLVSVMETSQRLSTTFRFETGTAALDIQSRSNVTSLARNIEAGVHDGRELIFVGFTDGDGTAAANLRLALNRAEAVRSAVLAAAPLRESGNDTLLVDAFGKAMPLACDDSDWGRRVNRRVEVWLR